MVSRHGTQVWHARSPGLAEVSGDNTLWLYVAVRNKQGINCLGGLNDPPPLPKDCKLNLPGRHHRNCTWSHVVLPSSHSQTTTRQGLTSESEFTWSTDHTHT